MFNNDDILVCGGIAVAAVLSVILRKISRGGGVAGVAVAAGLWFGAGITGLLLLAIFFVAGTAATSLQPEQKAAINLTPRSAGQVLANGSTAAAAALAMLLFPDHSTLLMSMMAGSLAAATSDTLSSEIGTVYGKRFYNILTLRRDERGLDGVISLEGSVAGVAATLLIALPFAFLTTRPEQLWITAIAGTAGNLADSLLGAALERRGTLGNDAVNFLNTLTGALTAGLLTMVF